MFLKLPPFAYAINFIAMVVIGGARFTGSRISMGKIGGMTEAGSVVDTVKL